MVDPHDPSVKGIGEVEHDGRPDSAHEEEANRAGTSMKSDESREGGGSDD